MNKPPATLLKSAAILLVYLAVEMNMEGIFCARSYLWFDLGTASTVFHTELLFFIPDTLDQDPKNFLAGVHINFVLLYFPA